MEGLQEIMGGFGAGLVTAFAMENTSTASSAW